MTGAPGSPGEQRRRAPADFGGLGPLFAAGAVLVVWAAVFLFGSEVGGTIPAPPDTALAGPALAPLPSAPFPADNPYSEAKVELGRLLYFDPRLSGDGSTSCNSCHPANDGSWTIASPISFGYPGTTHWRNSQTIYNVAYYTKLNWDGSAASIERQNDGAWTGTVAGNLDPAMAEERLAQIPEYVRRFKDVFGTDFPVYGDALRAVGAFQRTIVSRNAPLDAFLAGDRQAISDDARMGYELFTGRAGCLACHNGPLVSDDGFHNLGVPTPPDFRTNPLRQITVRWQYWSRGVPEDEYASMEGDLGLYYITRLESDKGRFRTPSLREACYTAPYMHNGAFATLEEVIGFYNAGGGEDPNRDPLLQPLDLTPQEQAALVAFLRSLCGDRIIVDAPPLPAYQPSPVLAAEGLP